MDQRTTPPRKLDIGDAETDVMIGSCTGLAIVILRVVVLLGILNGGSPIDWWVVSLVVVETALAGIFTFGVYRDRPWGAAGLLIIWCMGYFFSWYALGRVIPPLGIIGILVWVGLYRGM